MCQTAQSFCDSPGEKGGATPPALLLLLSRLCLDYETATISYILTLTDEQFLVQVSAQLLEGQGMVVPGKQEARQCPHGGASCLSQPNLPCPACAQLPVGSAPELPPAPTTFLSSASLAQDQSPVTPVSTLCAEARETARRLLTHYVKVQGLVISQMLRKSVETRDWLSTLEPRNVRAVMKRVVEDTTAIDVQVLAREP